MKAQGSKPYRAHKRAVGVSSPDRQSRTREVLDLTDAELEIVTVLICAAVTGLGPQTTRQIADRAQHLASRGLTDLRRRLWVETAGTVPRTREQLWRPSPHAFRRLGVQGWEVKLHTEEELDELRRTLPSVTTGLTAPIKVVEEQREAS